MIKVCPTCHCDPCRCMTLREALLFFPPLFLGMFCGGMIATLIYDDHLKAGVGALIGSFVGLIVGFVLAFRYGGRSYD